MKSTKLKYINIKVNFIYWWRSHKDTIIGIIETIILPFLIPIILLITIDQGDAEEDIKWCKKHGYTYPDDLGWDAHRQVKKWKKEFKRKEKELVKESIRKELEKEALN